MTTSADTILANDGRNRVALPAIPRLGAPNRRHRLLTGNAMVSWLVLAAAIVHPPHGLSALLCPSRLATGLPCPGCGLSRSLSCAIRGMWVESWAYHPFGIGILALLVGSALWAVLPPRMAEALRTRLAPLRPVARVALAAFVAAFLAFGAWRLLTSADRHAAWL